MKVLCIKNKYYSIQYSYVNNYSPSLTIGKYYKVIRDVNYGPKKYYLIYNCGFLISYEIELFKTEKEVRKEKLLKLRS
jgi:hypothetical protein